MPWLDLLPEYDADTGGGIFLLDKGVDGLVEGFELFGGERADVVEVEFEGVRGAGARGGGGG